MSHATSPNCCARTMLKVLRILKMKKVISSFSEASTSDEQQEDEWHHRVRSLVFSIAIVMFVSTGSIYALEASQPRSFSNNCYDDDDDSCQLEWHDAFYFVIVTLTTVGYGDILPMTWQARMLQSLLMLVGGAILANEIGMLIDACAQISPYGGAFEDWHVWTRLGMGKPVPHIVICSDRLNELTLFHLLEEIVHEDHHASRAPPHAVRARAHRAARAGAPSFGLQQVIGAKRHTDRAPARLGEEPGRPRLVEHARAAFVLTPGRARTARAPTPASAESIVLTASMVWLYIHRSTPAYLRLRVRRAAVLRGGGARWSAYTTDLSHLPSDVAARRSSRATRARSCAEPVVAPPRDAEVDKAQATLRKFWEHDMSCPTRTSASTQTYTREARNTLLDMRLTNVVSAHELKASVLALGTVHPGAIALVASLLAHSPIASTEDEASWQREYSDGLENELYVICLRDAATLPEASAATRAAVWDCPFNELALALFAHGALAVGVCDRAGAAHINPSGCCGATPPRSKTRDAAHVERDGETAARAARVGLHHLRSRRPRSGPSTSSSRPTAPSRTPSSTPAAQHRSQAPRCSPRRRARAAPTHKTYCIMCPTPRTMKMCSRSSPSFAPRAERDGRRAAQRRRRARGEDDVRLRAALWSEGLVRWRTCASSSRRRRSTRRGALRAVRSARRARSSRRSPRRRADAALDVTRPRDRGGDGDAAAAAERFFEGAALRRRRRRDRRACASSSTTVRRPRPTRCAASREGRGGRPSDRRGLAAHAAVGPPPRRAPTSPPPTPPTSPPASPSRARAARTRSSC